LELKLSAVALSSAGPTRPIDWIARSLAHASSITSLTRAPDVLPADGSNVKLALYAKKFPVKGPTSGQQPSVSIHGLGHPDRPDWISLNFTKDDCHLPLQLKVT
jgi:hypothetical protein